MTKLTATSNPQLAAGPMFINAMLKTSSELPIGIARGGIGLTGVLR